MTMELLRGTKLDALPPGDHGPLAKRLQLVFLKMCFEDGFVHADLHPGNMLLLDDGDIAIFDVGLVKHLSQEIHEQYIDFTRCLAMGTTKDFVGHIRRYHSYRGELDWAALEKDIGQLLSRFRGQNVAELEMGELMNDIFAIGRRYRARPLADMALVMVAMVTAEGIGKQLNPHANLFEDTAAFLGPLLARRAAGPPSPPSRAAGDARDVRDAVRVLHARGRDVGVALAAPRGWTTCSEARVPFATERALPPDALVPFPTELVPVAPELVPFALERVRGEVARLGPVPARVLRGR